jgi:predicted HTH transcriptional regulator
MPSPKEVFENPLKFIEFITSNSDDKFEGQHFDRKEACRLDAQGNIPQSELKAMRKHITETISAFANKNKEGGLLVLGISSNGEILGVNHLQEDQLNSFVNFNNLLRNQRAQANFQEFQDSNGKALKVCFIYSPYTSNAICETPSNSPDAWIRQNASNLPVNRELRDQLERDKGIVRFELSPCCPFDASELDKELLEKFKGAYFERIGNIDRTDEQILLNESAIVRDASGNLHFTNAGYLFFSIYPQSHLDWAYIRLLRFEASFSEPQNRGLPTNKPKEFRGSLTQQIRQIRTYIKDSAFFKSYTRRNPQGGGFIEEPEYPLGALDEAIVNAVAHRDYATQLPILIESYKDGLIVKNSGTLEQPDRDLPVKFSLADTFLESKPRNSKLIEWLKMMPSEQGTPFVFAVAEGTNTMRREMEKLNLPAPIFKIGSTQTSILLQNNSEEREALMRGEISSETTEYANLYPLNIVNHAGSSSDAEKKNRFLKRDILLTLKDALTAKGWYIDFWSYGRIVAHRRGVEIPLPKNVSQFVKFFPAYVFELRQYWGKYYLVIDFELQVKNVKFVPYLLKHFKAEELIKKNSTVKWNGWQRGRIEEANTEWSKIHLYDFDQVLTVPSSDVIPNLSKGMLDKLLSAEGINFDLSQAIKQRSLSAQPNAARERFERTQKIAESLETSIFPISLGGTSIYFHSKPSVLKRTGTEEGNFRTYTLSEPTVEFGRGKESSDIREGVTIYGSYEDRNKDIEIVPICSSEMRDQMVKLIERLKMGKYKYRGAERTFHTKFSYNSVINTSLENSLNECERLISEHPSWVSNENLNRIFLAQVPEQNYSLDDENSPYYKIKRFLLERGIPCQMIDTPTLQNPDWKDLNLALNITAKCGVVPWVLPDEIPDADFFVGLSYTQNSKKKSERHMGYANVFNRYGKWEFYSGNVATFSFEERAIYLGNLVSETLKKLPLSDTPMIHFHYSKRFSKIERESILDAARKVKPNGIYTFVWINNDHDVRLYDNRAESDGSLSRGSYVVSSPNQFYISTTGYNVYRKSLGTPKMLEINTYAEDSNKNYINVDLRIIANHILSLTKLNWASTDSLCGEPITTKYAGNIAYLTSAFLRQGSPLKLHKVLESTPWFI